MTESVKLQLSPASATHGPSCHLLSIVPGTAGPPGWMDSGMSDREKQEGPFATPDSEVSCEGQCRPVYVEEVLFSRDRLWDCTLSPFFNRVQTPPHLSLKWHFPSVTPCSGKSVIFNYHVLKWFLTVVEPIKHGRCDK